jgi:hypothetical protein
MRPKLSDFYEALLQADSPSSGHKLTERAFHHGLLLRLPASALSWGISILYFYRRSQTGGDSRGKPKKAKLDSVGGSPVSDNARLDSEVLDFRSCGVVHFRTAQRVLKCVNAWVLYRLPGDGNNAEFRVRVCVATCCFVAD